MTIEPEVAAPPAVGAKKEVPLGYVFAATGALLFSTKGIIVKLAYGYDVSPETLIALRAVFSLPFYLAIGAFAWINLRLGGGTLPSARLIGTAMLVGVFGVWFASYTDFIGLTLISAQFERLILFTYPLFVVLFGAMFFGQRIRARHRDTGEQARPHFRDHVLGHELVERERDRRAYDQGHADHDAFSFEHEMLGEDHREPHIAHSERCELTPPDALSEEHRA